MKTRPLFALHRRLPARTALFLCALLLGSRLAARADSATVATNANTLVTTAAAQTSPYTLTSGYSPSQSLALSNAENQRGDERLVHGLRGGGQRQRLLLLQGDQQFRQHLQQHGGSHHRSDRQRQLLQQHR